MISQHASTGGIGAHNAAGSVLTSPLFVAMITSFQGGLSKDLYDFARQCYPDWTTTTASQRRQRVRLLGIEVIRRGGMALLALAADVQFHEPVGRQLVARRIALPIQHAIENHRADMVRWIYTHGLDPHAHPVDMWNDAILYFNGDFAVLEELHRLLLTSSDSRTVIEIQATAAFQLLDMRLLEWVHEHIPSATLPVVRMMSEAIDAGRLDVVRFLHETHPDLVFRSDMYSRAWARGALDVLEFLLKHRSEPCTDRFLERVVANGSEHVREMVDQLRGLRRGARPSAIVEQAPTNTKTHSLML